MWRKVLNAGRATNSAKLDAAQQTRVHELRAEGILRGQAEQFLSPEGVRALAAVEKDVRALAESPKTQAVLSMGRNEDVGKEYMVRLIEFTTPQAADSAIVRLALDPALLEVIAGYMGIKPILHAAAAWLNFPTGAEASHSQLWHRDPEDVKLIKVFIYLDPVGPENGPFTYLPRTHPLAADSDKAPRHAHKRRIIDSEMMQAFPRDRWMECLGPAHSMIIADTVGFHRGGYVRQGHRLLVTFTYTSARPQTPRWLKVDGEAPADFNELQLAALNG
jgi:hypothetical protein